MRPRRERKFHHGARLLKAEKIVRSIVETDTPETHRENLRHLFDNFFLRYENPTQQFKESIYSTYTALDNALLQIQTTNIARA